MRFRFTISSPSRYSAGAAPPGNAISTRARCFVVSARAPALSTPIAVTSPRKNRTPCSSRNVRQWLNQLVLVGPASVESL
jgi:hypothetical protein